MRAQPQLSERLEIVRDEIIAEQRMGAYTVLCLRRAPGRAAPGQRGCGAGAAGACPEGGSGAEQRRRVEGGGGLRPSFRSGSRPGGGSHVPAARFCSR
eukprot:gene17744-biopygen2574